MRTGSFINALYDAANNPTVPEVGMGGTVVMWSDRHAVTVVEVSRTGHRVTVREDTATRIDGNGMSDAQTYSYEPNPAGRLSVFSRRKDGSYREVGGSTRLLLGARESYHDYSF